MKLFGYKRKKPAVLAVSLALLAVISVGGSLAWLQAAAEATENTFTPGTITTTVEEPGWTDGGTVKNNVSIAIEGNVPVYVRAAIVPTWEDGEGNLVAEPASMDDLTGFTSGQGWTKDGDYWYCTAVVTPDETGVANTPVLIDSIEVNKNSDGYQKGYQMNLQIVAEAVQASAIGDINNAAAWAALKNN